MPTLTTYNDDIDKSQKWIITLSREELERAGFNALSEKIVNNMKNAQESMKALLIILNELGEIENSKEVSV